MSHVRSWTKIIIVGAIMWVAIAVMQEYSQQRCSSPFWRGFGAAMGVRCP